MIKRFCLPLLAWGVLYAQAPNLWPGLNIVTGQWDAGSRALNVIPFPTYTDNSTSCLSTQLPPASSFSPGATVYVVNTGATTVVTCRSSGSVWTQVSGSGSGMVYPGAGLPISTGLAWGTSLTPGASGHVVRSNGTAYVDSALQSGDIPDNAANTSGTAANLSGTPALPNGTTATTQSQADGSTKLATTAYVDIGLGGKAASNAATTPNGQTCTLGSTCNVNNGAAAHSVALNEGAGSAIAGAAIGTAGRLMIDQGAGADPSFNTLSQDCTITSAGVITCTKSNNVSLGIFATATGATNAQTGTYQVLAADFTNLKTITVASGTFTITLVASGSQPTNGQYIDIINYGSGVVTVARSGQNINGGTTSLTIPAASATAPNSAHIISDASNYEASLSIGSGSGITITSPGGTIDPGGTPTNPTLDVDRTKVPYIPDIQFLAPNIGTGVLSSSNYNITMSPAPLQYTDSNGNPLTVIMLPGSSWGGGALTLNVGLGQKNAVMSDGSTAIPGGVIYQGVPILFTWCQTCNSSSGDWIADAFQPGIANALTAASAAGAANYLVVSAAASRATSFITPGTGVLTFLQTPSGANFNSMIAAGGVPIAQNSQSTAYTTLLSDGGGEVLHPASDNNARTFTIAANASVAYAIGTTITFTNLVNTLTIAINSDTLQLGGTSTTGSRTLAAGGWAIAKKVTSTLWLIAGPGLT